MLLSLNTDFFIARVRSCLLLLRMPTSFFLLPNSSGVATRPRGGASHWEALAATLQEDGLLAIDPGQPRTSGDPELASCSELETHDANCDSHPPSALDAKLCAGRHTARATAVIDLGSAAVLSSNNSITVWGTNTLCMATCQHGSGELTQYGPWRTVGQEGTGARAIPDCAGARTITLLGGGYCGGCWLVDGAPLSAQWLPPPAPPHPPESAPMPPPPWQPPPRGLRTTSIGLFDGFLFLPLACVMVLLFRHMQKTRQQRSLAAAEHLASRQMQRELTMRVQQTLAAATAAAWAERDATAGGSSATSASYATTASAASASSVIATAMPVTVVEGVVLEGHVIDGVPVAEGDATGGEVYEVELTNLEEGGRAAAAQGAAGGGVGDGGGTRPATVTVQGIPVDAPLRASLQLPSYRTDTLTARPQHH